MYHLPVLIIQPCLWPGCMVADRGYVSWLTCSKMWWSNSCSPPQRNRVKGLTSTYIIQPWQSWLPLLGLLIHSCLQEFICSCPKWRTVKIDVELWHIMYYLKRAESQNYLYQNESRDQSRYSNWIGWAIEEWDNFFKQQSKNNFFLLFSSGVTKRQIEKLKVLGTCL